MYLYYMEVIKSGGETEVFNADKFCSSVRSAGASEDTAQNICTVIQEKLTPGVTTTKIFREAMRQLVDQDVTVATNYGLRRAIDALGPAGFLFEQYVEALMQAHGYETQRNVMMQGQCVDHEIDVIARSKNKTILIEAKYKNQHNFKTHLDVVMYADSRFMDIQRGQEKSKDKKLKDSLLIWLVTNTKFTDKAQKYAGCRDVHLRGWGYPKTGNLEDMIISKKVYPITALPSISHFEREQFAKKNMILAQDLLPYTPEQLTHDFGIPPEIATKLRSEVDVLFLEKE